MSPVPCSPCSVDDCRNAARRGGLCWAHLKRRGRGQVVSAALALRHRSPLERLWEAVLAYGDADGDEDYARARNNILKSVAAARSEAIGELTRAALRLLKAKGVHLGPPFKLKPSEARAALEAVGSVSGAAERLHVSRPTLYRALRHEEDGK